MGIISFIKEKYNNYKLNKYYNSKIKDVVIPYFKAIDRELSKYQFVDFNNYEISSIIEELKKYDIHKDVISDYDSYQIKVDFHNNIVDFLNVLPKIFDYDKIIFNPLKYDELSLSKYRSLVNSLNGNYPFELTITQKNLWNNMLNVLNDINTIRKQYNCIFRIIPARVLGNCRPHQNGEANLAEGLRKAVRQDIL